MTTTYHDAIATGAPANASTFNGPLGDLDAAITQVDDRVDNIIASSGTSSTEVVDARGGYSVLDGRLDDLDLKNNVLLVDSSFAVTNTAAGRFKTITLALAQCSGGETILIAPGIYVENVTLADNDLKIIGSGMPAYDDASGRLVGGTIIRGWVRVGTVTGFTLRDFGVDVADLSTGANDCIGSGTGAFRADRVYMNLALRGYGDMSGAGNSTWAHGIYVTGSNNFLSNIKVHRCYHGIAVHGQHVNMVNIYAFACYGTSVVIKGKNGYDVYDVNIANLQIEGTLDFTNGRAGSLQIQNADATNTYDVNITNVVADYCVLGAFQIFLGMDNGTIHDINITNMISRHCQNLALLGDYQIIEVTNLTLTNCHSLQHGGTSFQIDDAPTVSGLRLFGCSADGSTSTRWRTVDAAFYDVLELNGDYWRRTGIILSPTIFGTFMASTVQGATSNGSVSVTAANTPIANLTGAGQTTEFMGMVFVFARNGVATANNSASYLLHIHKHYNNTTLNCTLVSSGGLTTGAASTSPSFTFNIDGTANTLRASPVGSTSGAFWFTFSCFGDIKALPV